ncbi:type IV pilus biogenesis protein PilM [Ralstonia sp. ASV6]|uniref:type IV pilus biogenesis protein PilM n=1 Tax=Ralstonia sp. ASV6 TaxID=2795124 RepID=UPI0018EE225C|nr:type IV pilus biogenesis protein PilM [Ralstonia sp. ASV6]
MQFFAPLLMMLFLTNLMVSMVVTTNARIKIDQAEVSATAQNMVVYGAYASKYAAANPTFTGAAANAAIGFPTWYIPPATIKNYMVSGKAYVYYTGLLTGIPYYIVQSSQDGFRAGYNNNGVFTSPVVPAAQTASVTIPAGVPNGVQVLMP